MEKPIMLAEYLWRDHSKWNIFFLKLEIGQRFDDRAVQAEYQSKRAALRRKTSSSKTIDIILYRKIPVYIDYYLARVDDDRYLNFREDVYRKDKVLIEYMFPEKELLARR